MRTSESEGGGDKRGQDGIRIKGGWEQEGRVRWKRKRRGMEMEEKTRRERERLTVLA